MVDVAHLECAVLGERGGNADISEGPEEGLLGVVRPRFRGGLGRCRPHVDVRTQLERLGGMGSKDGRVFKGTDEGGFKAAIDKHSVKPRLAVPLSRLHFVGICSLRSSLVCTSACGRHPYGTPPGYLWGNRRLL